MGRHVAGKSFLKAALTHSSKSDLWIQVEHKKHIGVFKSIADSCGRHEKVNTITRSSLKDLTKPGCLYLPGPGLGDWARHRSRYGASAWSICGITHTTASKNAMDAIAELITVPVHPWDALICTSRAVQNNVRRILSAESEYLKQRLGISKIVLPQLPIIPLGVNTNDFKRSKSTIMRARQQLNIHPDDIVILFVGRLSFHAKAHPLVMYQALERAATATGRQLVLVECGWYANAHIQKAFTRASSAVCPSVRCISLDGRDPKQLALSWESADLFCSLSDNIQETFGITPIEAMAAGLPVVVSDWDGYRDTVRDGIDGFRIPTFMPPPGYGDELASRHAIDIDTYDMYCAHTSALVAVDLDCTVQALIRLISSSELRQRMGAQGRKHVINKYDWEVIIPSYESLWSELKSRRRRESNLSRQHYHSWSSRLDPFYGFAAYPTKKILKTTLIRLSDSSSDISIHRLRQLIQLEMVNYVSDRMSSQEELESVLRSLSSQSTTVENVLLTNCSHAIDQKKLFLSIAWMIKLGLIKIENY